MKTDNGSGPEQISDPSPPSADERFVASISFIMGRDLPTRKFSES